MKTVFSSPSEYFAQAVKPEYKGVDVFLTVSNQDFKDTGVFMKNPFQNVENPPKLHLTLENCNFDGASASQKQLYVTNAQELIIKNCVFANNSVADYGVDVNLCSIQGALITIDGCTFNATGQKSAIKISARRGETDNPPDITVKTPATISKVTIKNCTFSGNVCDYTIGTTPKGEDVDANTTTGAYPVELENNSGMIVKEPYIYDKDVDVPVIDIKAGRSIYKEADQNVTEVSKFMFTSKQVDALNNMNEAARQANLGTVLNENLGGEEGAAFTPAEHQDNSVASDVPGLVADFNALLAKLQAAGLME